MQVGSRLDYYCVEAFEPGRLIRLRSLLRAPGEGWLEWRGETQNDGGIQLKQTAFFAPRGLPGFLYWLALAPLHGFMLRGLLDAVKKKSEAA